jgi:hypothetical protein
MEENRIARLERSALECANMAAKTHDPRAQAVLTTAVNVWRSLAKQRGYQGQSKQTGELVDHVFRSPAGVFRRLISRGRSYVAALTTIIKSSPGRLGGPPTGAA